MRQVLHLLDGISQSHTGRKTEADGEDGSWPVWFTDIGPRFWLSLETALSGTSPAICGMRIEHGEHRGVALILRLKLGDHVIVVLGG